jgi:hypothetical protein
MLRLRLIVAAVTFFSFATHSYGGIIGEYTFSSTEASADPLMLDFVPNSTTDGPSNSVGRAIHGATYADANSFAESAIGTVLGTAGRLTPPDSGTNNFGFWLHKGILSGLDDWSILFWANRRAETKSDFLLYIGTSDGFGGGSAETYVFATVDGTIGADNFTSASADSLDMTLSGGYMSPGQWHQIGLVRSGTSLSLYFDGQPLGTDSDVTLNSLANPANSMIVFGGIKSTSNAANRARVLDGMIDQIEIYDSALTRADLQAQFAAVPEASTFSLVVACIGMATLRKIVAHTRRLSV